MLLYILRHGDAESYARQDSDRALSPTGVRENQIVINEFVQKDPELTTLVCSPYRRAQETAKSVIDILPELVKIDSEMLVPDVPVADLVSYLDELESSKKLESLMLVGHNPLLSKLVSFLVEGQETGNQYLGTSNLVCLTTQYIAPAGSEINYWIRPRS